MFSINVVCFAVGAAVGIVFATICIVFENLWNAYVEEREIQKNSGGKRK